MRIDCTTCIARDVACGDCVVNVLLSAPPPAVRPGVSAARSPAVELDDDERQALGTLAAAGLVPPLRLVRAMPENSGLSREIA